MQYSFQELSKTIRELRDLSSDLLNSNHDTIETGLNFFKDFCDHNRIIQDILEPIIENQFNTTHWYRNAVDNQSSMVGSGDPTLPIKSIDSLTVIYDILWDQDAKNLITNFIFNTMYTKNYDEMIRRFNDNFTKRLIRYIIRQLEEKIELVKPQSNNHSPNTWNFHGPTNFASQSSNVSQNIQINNPELLEVVNQMRTIIDASELNISEKQDALETIELLEAEISKPEPSKSKIEKIISFLPAVESLISFSENIISKLS